MSKEYHKLSQEKKTIGVMETSVGRSTAVNIKIKNFRSSTGEVRSDEVEIFPGKNIVFVVKKLPKSNPTNGRPYTDLYLPGEVLTAVSENDQFFSLELVAGQGVNPPKLAGMVNITLGNSNQHLTFGDHLQEEYLEFDPADRSIVLKPGKVKAIRTEAQSRRPKQKQKLRKLAAKLFHVKLSEAAGVEETLEIQFTLFTQILEGSLPDPLKSSITKIMKDESTADMKISCGEKDNKKIFNVHKVFIASSSPVFRAAVETDMVEGRTKEIYIEEDDENSVQEMINYIYTRDFSGGELNVQMLAWLADKYNISGMMELLLLRMEKDQVVDPVKVADMLIAAGKTIQNFSPNN